MYKNHIEISMCLSYTTGIVSSVGTEIYVCCEDSFSMDTTSKEGLELLKLLSNCFPLDKVSLCCVSLGKYPEYSASLNLNTFKNSFKKFKQFEKMLCDMKLDYYESRHNCFDIHISFKPLNVDTSKVDLAWTSVAQWLNGEIGVRPNDR